MAFDGLFLYCLKQELNAAIGSHIDKIYQPSKEELVLLLRKKGFVKRLLLSAKSGMARMQFTEDIPENPDSPPMFCALARKHFSAAYFEDIKLFGFERVAELLFSGTNEMGDRVKLKIVCEFIGTTPNIILVDSNNKVFDAVHRTDLEASRIIMPGSVYCYPEKQEKINILNGIAPAAEAVLKKGTNCSSAVLSSLSGFSPLVSREVAFLAFGEDIPLDQEVNIKQISNALETVVHYLENPVLTVLYDKGGKPKEFSFMPIKQYGDYYTEKTFDSFQKLLDTFWGERERINRTAAAGGDVIRLVKNLLSRAERRKEIRKQEIKQTEKREQMPIFGELIKANIHSIPAGAKKATVQNFYDSELKTVEIPLDPALNAQANAAKYFKEYKKSYNAKAALEKLIEKDISETEYLKSVEESIMRAKTLSDINEIREELLIGGYIKQPQKKNAPKRKKAFSPLEYNKNGFKILVGKNNLQNDYITCTLAKKGDIWFHTKNIHGAHTVIFTEGRTVDEETLLFAAKLAAKNSKAAFSSQVPVDYTDIKYVKKPSGAKAGMVIYTVNKTLFVTPEEEL